MTKEICEKCGQTEEEHPVYENDEKGNEISCEKFKPKNQSRFQNHINVIKEAKRIKDGSDDNLPSRSERKVTSESLSDKIEGLKADDLAMWYKEHEKFMDGLSSMEICNENHNCNEFVIKKLKEKISKDVKEAVKKLKKEDEGLKKQLLIDFKTPLSVESAQRFIKARFESSARIKKDKIFGKGLA